MSPKMTVVTPKIMASFLEYLGLRRCVKEEAIIFSDTLMAEPQQYLSMAMKI
jgi:hypothetical protein